MRWIPFNYIALLGAALAALGALACANGGAVAGDGDAGPDAAPLGDARGAALTCADEPCFPGAECSDDGSGFQCGPCPAGTEGDGRSCSDIDGCAGDPCAEGVTCTDVAAPDDGYRCGACPSGQEGDGETCTEIDGCADDPCADGVTCLDVLSPGTGHACGECPAGTEGDGESCADIDGCADPDACFPGVACTDVPAPDTGFDCGACPSGYHGDGESCEAACQPELSLGCGSSISSTTTGLGSRDVVDDWECASVALTGREIVFSFTASSTGVAAATLSNLSADLDLMVIEDVGGMCNPDDSLGCVAGGYSGTGGTAAEQVRWSATQGTTYHLVVDGYGGASGSFDLRVGTAAADVLLNEVSSGSVDFVEVRNHGACPVNLGSFSLHHAPSCQASFSHALPALSLPASGIHRVVESGVTLGSGESSFGASVCDDANQIGFTALCVGSCDLTGSCSGVVDYVERDGDLADLSVPATPACLSFTPEPVDVSALAPSGSTSVRRTGLQGWPATFYQSDWGTGSATR